MMAFADRVSQGRRDAEALLAAGRDGLAAGKLEQAAFECYRLLVERREALGLPILWARGPVERLDALCHQLVVDPSLANSLAYFIRGCPLGSGP